MVLFIKIGIKDIVYLLYSCVRAGDFFFDTIDRFWKEDLMDHCLLIDPK